MNTTCHTEHASTRGAHAPLSRVRFGTFVLRHSSRRVLFLATAFCALVQANAQTIWNGLGADSNWGTAANWNNSVATINPSGSVLQFAGSVGLTPNVNAPWTV